MNFHYSEKGCRWQANRQKGKERRKEKITDHSDIRENQRL
jgi:hypothetical protein